MDMIIAFIGAAVIFAMVILMLPMIYNYRFSNNRIEVVLFGAIPIYGINMKDVESISIGGWRDLGLFTVHFGNRLRSSGVVVISKRSGLFHRVAITPRDPESFVAAAKRGHSSA